MLKYYIFLCLLFFASAGYHCRTPTDCTITCSNFSPRQIASLSGTKWIAVPYDTGLCYFHNVETREDTSYFPIKNLRIQPVN